MVPIQLLSIMKKNIDVDLTLGRSSVTQLTGQSIANTFVPDITEHLQRSCIEEHMCFSLW